MIITLILLRSMSEADFATFHLLHMKPVCTKQSARKQPCLEGCVSLFLQVYCLLLFAVAVASVVARRSQRSKRGILELAGIINCSTGRSALAYMVYGCYCGLGGQGWPRDRADW